MTNLANYVKSEEFGGDAKSLPEGESFLDTQTIEVEEASVEFDGKQKKRFILHVGDEGFWVGPKVMKGIQKAVKEGARLVKVIKQGSGKETSYIVLAADGEAKQ